MVTSGVASPPSDPLSRFLRLCPRLAFPLWLLAFLWLATLPAFDQPAGDEEASYQPGRADPSYSWSIERMRALRDAALTPNAFNATHPPLPFLNDGDAEVFERYHRLFSYAAQPSQAEVTILPPTTWATEPALLAILRPAIRDPREALFVSCPMDIWGLNDSAGLIEREGAIKWAVRLADLFAEIGKTKWLAKDVYVIVSPTTDRNGSHIDHATGTRQFLQWYLEDREGSSPIGDKVISRGGIARAALVLPEPVATGEPFAVHLQYEALDNVTPNVDFVTKAFKAFTVHNAPLHYHGFWDAVLHQLEGHTRNEHHTAFLERQIAAMGLQMRGPWKKRHVNKSHWTSFARLVEDILRESNSLVMQFHHLSNLYFLTGGDNGDIYARKVVRANEFLMPVLFMSIALFLLDVPALTSCHHSHVDGWLSLPRRAPFASVFTQSCAGVGIIVNAALVALTASAYFISRKATSSAADIQSICTSTLDLADTRVLGLDESVLIAASLAGALTLFLLCFIGSKAFENDSRRDAAAGLVKAAAMGIRLTIPVIVFPLTIVSPATGIVVTPLLTFMGFICYIYSEAQPIYGAIFLVAGPALSTILRSQWAAQYGISLLKENVPHVWKSLQPLLNSKLADRILDDPAGLVETVTMESLKSHLCLGSHTYPMLVLALTYFTFIFSTTLFTLGIRVRAKKPVLTERRLKVD